MMHLDINTANAIIAARHEQVARMLSESRRPGALSVGIGTLLVRLGGWLAKDAPAPVEATPVLPPRERPQIA